MQDEGTAAIHVHVVDFNPTFRSDFRRLNLEWLERWFTVEDVDVEVLEHPERTILDAGGHILFAVADDGSVVGTVALRHEDDNVYELTKMAVVPTLRGRGIGRVLGQAAIDRFKEVGGRRLVLESNDQLEAALALYERLGFEHVPRHGASAYGRANVFMEWRPSERPPPPRVAGADHDEGDGEARSGHA